MVSQPNFGAASWKLARLGDLIGADPALAAVTRLWWYCQDPSRRDIWPDGAPELVEGVARWSGSPGELYKHLLACKWIEELPGGGIRIQHWAEQNCSLVKAWDTWKVHKSKHINDLSARNTHKTTPRGPQDTHRNVTRDSQETPKIVSRASCPSDHTLSVHQGTGTTSSVGRGVGEGAGGAPPPRPPKEVAPLPESSKRKPSAKRAAAALETRKANLRGAFSAFSAEDQEFSAKDVEQGGLSAEDRKRQSVVRARMKQIQEEQKTL